MNATFAVFLLAGSSAAFLLALFAAPVVAALARQFGIVDRPTEGGRKKHGASVPLLGGLAVFVPIALIIAVLAEKGVFNGSIFMPAIPGSALWGLVLGGAVLMIGGALDDRYNLRPGWQFVFPVLAALIAVASGIHIPYIRSPFADSILVIPDAWSLPLTFAWLLVLMYTTKFLDGLDGLVTGLTGIAAIVMFFVALRPEVGQPAVAILALVVAGAFVGFLPWNWTPARVFLGEGGSLFAGYVIGILAIISGSKVATTLLVLGIPLLDVLAVVIQRAVVLRVPPTRGDRSHLHFRLVDAGMSVPAAVLLLYAVALIFGMVGLFGETRTKAIAFFLLMLIVSGGVALLLRSFKGKR